MHRPVDCCQGHLPVGQFEAGRDAFPAAFPGSGGGASAQAEVEIPVTIAPHLVGAGAAQPELLGCSVPAQPLGSGAQLALPTKALGSLLGGPWHGDRSSNPWRLQCSSSGNTTATGATGATTTGETASFSTASHASARGACCQASFPILTAQWNATHSTDAISCAGTIHALDVAIHCACLHASPQSQYGTFASWDWMASSRTT
mmetsp:Transcript_24277/g.52866  ORF Transcript_24277/g.52866 Transcript_24277/m.52866 type:complete len:203 (-) Transcript_24277:75-683(-)